MEDPNKPFSALRVAIWGIGVITLIATVVSGFYIFEYQETPPAPFPAVVLAGISNLAMTAGYAAGRNTGN